MSTRLRALVLLVVEVLLTAYVSLLAYLLCASKLDDTAARMSSTASAST